MQDLTGVIGSAPEALTSSVCCCRTDGLTCTHFLIVFRVLGDLGYSMFSSSMMLMQFLLRQSYSQARSDTWPVAAPGAASESSALPLPAYQLSASIS